jgi:hypothetical protein
MLFAGPFDIDGMRSVRESFEHGNDGVVRGVFLGFV